MKTLQQVPKVSHKPQGPYDQFPVSFIPKQVEILRAALTELDLRLSRGMANSELQDETVRILERQRVRISGFHESDVGELLRKLDQLPKER